MVTPAGSRGEPTSSISSTSTSTSSSQVSRGAQNPVSKTIKSIVKDTHFEAHGKRPQKREIIAARLLGKAKQADVGDKVRTEILQKEADSKAQNSEYENYLSKHQDFYDLGDIKRMQGILKNVRNTNFSSVGVVTRFRLLVAQYEAGTKLGKPTEFLESSPVKFYTDIKQVLRLNFEPYFEAVQDFRLMVSQVDPDFSLFAIDLICREVPETYKLFFPEVTDSSQLTKENLEVIRDCLSALTPENIVLIENSTPEHVAPHPLTQANAGSTPTTTRPVPPPASAKPANTTPKDRVPGGRPLPTPPQSTSSTSSTSSTNSTPLSKKGRLPLQTGQPPSTSSVNPNLKSTPSSLPSARKQELGMKYENLGYKIGSDSYLLSLLDDRTIEGMENRKALKKLDLEGFITKRLETKDKLDANDIQEIKDHLKQLDTKLANAIINDFRQFNFNLHNRDMDYPVVEKAKNMFSTMGLPLNLLAPNRKTPILWKDDDYKSLIAFAEHIDDINS